jgi:hypothetical protein
MATDKQTDNQRGDGRCGLNSESCPTDITKGDHDVWKSRFEPSSTRFHCLRAPVTRPTRLHYTLHYLHTSMEHCGSGTRTQLCRHVAQ